MAKRKGHRACTICTHPQVYEIELSLVSGVTCPAVAKKYHVSKDAVWRHRNNHISPERKAELVAGPLSIAELVERATNEGMSLLDYCAIVRNALMSRFLAAAENGDGQGAAVISGKLLECLRLVAQVSGELTRATSNYQTNVLIMNSPLMSELQSMLIRELSPFPEARTRVVAGLEELSKRALPTPPPNGAGGSPVIEAQYVNG